MRSWIQHGRLIHHVSAALTFSLAALSPAAIAAPISPDVVRSADLRLAAIGYRLAHVNAALCDRSEMMTGLAMHDAGGYAPATRKGGLDALGLTTGFGVLSITADSAAARAGILSGDEILKVNDVDLATFRTDQISARASYDRMDSFLMFLSDALQQGPVAIVVRRGTTLQTLSLSGDAGCGGQFTVQPGKALNAWSDGKYVAVTTGLMNRVSNDNELAFVIAHEMAHNILRHREQLEGRSALFAQLGIGAGKVKATEVEADSYAIKLMAGAGFDLEGAGQFLASFSKARWMDLPITHPGIRRRIEIVNAAIASVRNNQNNILPLPTMRFASTTVAPPEVPFATGAWLDPLTRKVPADFASFKVDMSGSSILSHKTRAFGMTPEVSTDFMRRIDGWSTASGAITTEPTPRRDWMWPSYTPASSGRTSSTAFNGIAANVAPLTTSRTYAGLSLSSAWTSGSWPGYRPNTSSF